MIYSMTGYAAVSDELPLGMLSIEIRSVNHRYLDVQFRLPTSSAPSSQVCASCRCAAHARQGGVPDGIQNTPASRVSLGLNIPLLDQLVELDRRVRGRLPGASSLTVSDIIRWPGSSRPTRCRSSSCATSPRH